MSVTLCLNNVAASVSEWMAAQTFHSLPLAAPHADSTLERFPLVVRDGDENDRLAPELLHQRVDVWYRCDTRATPRSPKVKYDHISC